MIKTRLFSAMTALILIAGCAAQPGHKTPPAGQAPQQTPPAGQSGAAGQPMGNENGEQINAPEQAQAPPRQASEVSSPAVMSLLHNADNLASNGKMEAAASVLERAQNLDPRNPFIYQRMAAARLAQNQYGQAEQLAMKSNSVAGNNPFVKADNWQLIAQARAQSNDQRGASKAKAQAVNYRQATSQYAQ